MLTQISKFLHTTTEPLVLLILAIIISTFLYFYPYNLQPTTYNGVSRVMPDWGLARKRAAILLASTSIVTAITIKILKNVVQAPRPIASLIQETGYSFPSGHTTFAVVFFGLLVYIFAKTTKQKIISSTLATLLTITIALSRLQLQVHHPADIIGGLIIGGIILTLSILIHKNINK